LSIDWSVSLGKAVLWGVETRIFQKAFPKSNLISTPPNQLQTDKKKPQKKNQKAKQPINQNANIIQINQFRPWTYPTCSFRNNFFFLRIYWALRQPIVRDQHDNKLRWFIIRNFLMILLKSVNKIWYAIQKSRFGFCKKNKICRNWKTRNFSIED
jgi:hypothetical protein